VRFYTHALGATLEMLSRYGEAPMEVQPGYENRIIHARLSFGDNVLMISDASPGNEVANGHNVQLSLNFVGDDEAARKTFERLSSEGKVTQPLAQQFWGALFGMCVDKFGIAWMVNGEPAVPAAPK
jgi:PhnB protein